MKAINAKYSFLHFWAVGIAALVLAALTPQQATAQPDAD